MPPQRLLANCLPRDILSKQGRSVRLLLLDASRHADLLEMYLAYQPRNCFQGLPPIRDEVCTKWVEGMIRDGFSIVAVPADGEAVVGHVAIFPINPRKCELLVVVAPPFQNQGIGTELVRSAAELADERGFRQVWLPVDATNGRARRVYEKCGFDYTSSRLARELDMALDLAQKKRFAPSCAAPPPPPPHVLSASLGLTVSAVAADA